MKTIIEESVDNFLKFDGIRNHSDIKRQEHKTLDSLKLPKNIHEAFIQGESLSKGRDALKFIPDASKPNVTYDWSFSDFIAEIEATARGIKAVSKNENPTISILLPNLPETHFAIWGGQLVGKINPINPMLEYEQIVDILKTSQSTILITLTSILGQNLYEKAIKAVKQVPEITTLVTVNPLKYVSFTKKIIASLLRRPKFNLKGIQIIKFSSLKHEDNESKLPTKNWDDVGALFHTGGTTGKPKIAQLTHGNQIFVSWAAANNRIMRNHKSIFCGLPLFHVNAVLVTGLVMWMKGMTVVLGPAQGFRSPNIIENFWKIIEMHKIGAMSAVPTIYQMLVDQDVGEIDISSLEFAICGAAPLSKTVMNKFQKLTGTSLLEGYGFTEGACVSSITPGFGEQRVGSVGLRLPYQLIEIFKETNSGEFRKLARGETGIVAVVGPNIFKGYVGLTHDESVWINDDKNKWYNTGDMGYIDEDGYLWLTGRKKELIIRGGHNIDPSTIEEVILSHPLVEHAAAIGSPDARLGEIPVLYLTLIPKAKININKLMIYLKTHLSEQAANPKKIIIIDKMPLTLVGKIFKPELIQREVSSLISNVVFKINNDSNVSVRQVYDTNQTQVYEICFDFKKTKENDLKRIESELSKFTFKWKFTTF
jgi:fatty-acyl-CoA synthase